jgi:3-hydroxyisobutyrate dehydrogenase-like beta-hydroxyacid dehydrogenase
MGQQVGFIGIGMMGHGMVKNLLAKGYGVTFKANKRRDNLDDLLAAGAREARTPAEVARAAGIVFLCVPGSPQVEQIVYGEGGLLEAARPGLMVVDTSTSEPSSTARIRQDLAAKGARLVDAPLARTPKEAEEGRLNSMVGADPADFREVEPVLRAFCENIFHVGPPGCGHVLKLVNNMLAMTVVCATAEAFAVAAKSGLDLVKAYEVISAGGVNCGVFQMMTAKPLKDGDLDSFRFGIANAQKDLGYYSRLVAALQVPSPIGDATHQSLVRAAAMGHAGKLVTSLLEVQEQVNQVSIVARAARP